ncbi:hypothetical protein B8W86_05175 [Lactobacillus kefiranofaciens]|nr:hypothetical protein B8W86_05175 [Lactobacillus kefiranofaciens]
MTKVGYWDILIQFLVIAGINLFIGFHNVNKATSIIEKIVGAFFPKTGADIGLSMYQNPSFRNAITKAYH